MLGKERVSEILSQVISDISRRGLEGEAVCHVSEEQTVRSAWTQIHQSPLARSVDLTIFVRRGNKRGSISFNNTTREAIRSAISKADAIAKLSPENIYLSDLVSLKQITTPEYNSAALDEETASHAWHLKVKVLNKAHKASGTINCKASGRFFTGVAEIGVANTQGLLRYMSFGAASFSLVMTGDSHLSSFAKRCDLKISGINDEQVIEEAIKTASIAKTLPFYDPFQNASSPRRFDVIIHPYALHSWIEWLCMFGFNGLMVHEKQSFLSDRMGELVTGRNVTIRDNWTYPGFPAMPFDLEGTNREKTTLIKNGVAINAVYDGSTAKKCGVTSSGHSTRSNFGAIPLHIIFEGGGFTEDDLIASCERPTIYITYFNYPGMPDAREAVFTATTRHGTFLIEDGRLTQVMPPLRFKEKTAEALSRVQGMTGPMIILGEENYEAFFPQSIAVPCIKIKDCLFVGSNQYN